MPEITALGWFHTAMGIVALVSGAYTLIRFREIVPQNRSAQVYLATTLITAGTALAIFQHGGFGAAHGLAVLTLAALIVGMAAATTRLFGRLSRYVQALGFSATLLFHCVPAVTDALLRLPVGNPMVTSLDDPLMKTSHLVLLLLFIFGISLQLAWIYRQEQSRDQD
jgi:uncharacterized membrane protein